MKGKRKATAATGVAAMRYEDGVDAADGGGGVFFAAGASSSKGAVVEVLVQEEKVLAVGGGSSGENNNKEGEGVVEEEEEGKEGEEEGEEGEEEEEEGEEEEEEEEERPKLDEGFFEIEAIRRKRVRKGQLQYFIKWRGWPETANTWEPLENLQSCADVIDAFEESLRSGKSSRKRKRKHAGPHSQGKKKQPRASAADTVTGVGTSAADEAVPAVSLTNSSLADVPATVDLPGSGHEDQDNRDVNNIKLVKQADEMMFTNGSKQIPLRTDDGEYDPKLSELRGIMSNSDANGDKIGIHFRDGRALEADGPVNVQNMIGPSDPQPSSRQTGARRRKSSFVKRFTKDSTLSEPVNLQNSPSNVLVGTDSATAEPLTRDAGFIGRNSNHKPMGEDSTNPFTITKILKPIGFKASVVDNVQEVLVTFTALRSDGTEVQVDNRFLKAHYPILLINFYEHHLKYCN